MRRMPPAAALVLALLVVALAVPAAARADGDPASDWLITKDVFIPADLGVPQAYANQLGTVLQDAKQHGFTIRVALIGSRYDLGSIPIMFHQPKHYAQFLSYEVRFAYRGPILTVMSNGYGAGINGQRDPARQAILDRMQPPGNGGARIASGATRAVVRLAAARGVKVAVPPLHGSTASGTATEDRITIIVVVLIAAALGALVWLVRRRRPIRRRT